MTVRELLTVAATEVVQGDYHLLIFDAPAIAAQARPGQFVMVQTSAFADPMLPRPFSIHRWRGPRGEARLSISTARADAGRQPGQFEILFKAVGPATRLLAQFRPGSQLWCLGPLGGRGFRPFADAAPPGPVILVAGGYGVAPLYGYARELLSRHPLAEIHLCYGARTTQDLLILPLFREIGVELHIATDDGSTGFRGKVTGALEAVLNATAGRSSFIAACGPDRMLHAVAAMALARGVACEVSMESYMPCGFGVCLGCVVKDTGGKYRTVCREGPIFDAQTLFHAGGIDDSHAGTVAAGR